MCNSYNSRHDSEITARSVIQARFGRFSHADFIKLPFGFEIQALSGKETIPIMKNTKKSFSQSLRYHLREGFILYAAANTRYPANAELIQLYRQTIDEENV